MNREYRPTVAAAEVRSLAECSAQAAKDINRLISNSNVQVEDGLGGDTINWINTLAWHSSRRVIPTESSAISFQVAAKF